MKKFNFRLQKILDLREKLEAAQKLKLASAFTAYQSILHRQEEYFAQAAQQRASAFIPLEGSTLNIEELRRADEFLKHAEKMKAALQPSLEKARLLMEKEQAEYNKRHRETQALTVLRNKRLAEYRKEELREETAEIDEMSKRPRI